ncbi:MAG: TerB N-terminal domain-containing protein [Ruminiclostridium sp.]|nr:TerB N-terminal domain-containing protein [Ruminiclostridium sp.]
MKNVSFSGKVYNDVPLLRVASELPQPPKRNDAVPDRILEMKRLVYSPEFIGKSYTQVFYDLGKFMEDFEDDCPYPFDIEVQRPSYSYMTAEQLRGYFTWRTGVRRGEYRPAPTVFRMLYMYELLNLIGVKNAEEAYRKIREAEREFSSDPALCRLISGWIKDLVVYYGLPKEYAFEPDTGTASALKDYAESTDNELFKAMMTQSYYDIGGSSFYKAYPDDFRFTACTAYRKLAAHYDKHNKRSLFEKYFVYSTSYRKSMFTGAVFLDKLTQTRVYDAGNNEKYECRNGEWYYTRQLINAYESRSFGDFMRSVDCLMRNRFRFRFKMRKCEANDTEKRIIEESIDELMERKRLASLPKIEIDVEKLGNIRKSADSTRDKLIVDEEAESADPETPVPKASVSETPVPVTPAPETPSVSEEPPARQSADDHGGLPLNDEEYAFLHRLLYGGTAPTGGTLPSLLADSVNEKLFDLFGDTVLEIGGGEPCVIEDYTDELKGMIKE